MIWTAFVRAVLSLITSAFGGWMRAHRVHRVYHLWSYTVNGREASPAVIAESFELKARVHPGPQPCRQPLSRARKAMPGLRHAVHWAAAYGALR